MKFIKIVFCGLLFVLPMFLFSATEVFPRTLYVGMRGEDVRELQKVLNKDIETRIAEMGAGSLGNETNYFGTATKRALIQFQEKYRTEILAPSGLTSGTGIFGTKTRAKVTILLNTASVAKSVTTPTQVSIPVQKGEVIVMFPSQYSGTAGTMIEIFGAGFTTKDNTIYFGDGNAVGKAVSPDGQSITFKIPAIPKGVYPLFVKNARGDSNRDSFFVVTDGVTPEPKIESISPARATRGDVVTVKGSGFLAKGNTVRTGINIIENVSSADGRAISFSIPVDVFISTTTASSEKFTIPVWVYVVNENGVSNGKSFSLEL